MIPPEADEFASRFPDEIRMLLAMLRMSNLGGLAVAECDDLDLRARLLDYFRRRLEADNIYLFNYEVSAKDTNLVRSLTELTDHSRFKNLELTGKYKSIVIFVYGTEKFTDEQRQKFITLLNFLRDRLTMIAQPIVIWGTPAFVTSWPAMPPIFGTGKVIFSASRLRPHPLARSRRPKPNQPTVMRISPPSAATYAESSKTLIMPFGKTFTCRSRPPAPPTSAPSRLDTLSITMNCANWPLSSQPPNLLGPTRSSLSAVSQAINVMSLSVAR